MNQKPAEVSDKITLLIFKDNFAARTFQIPLKWISQFGIFFVVFAGFTFVSIAYVARYYFIVARGSPAHIRDLETEITNLKSSIKLMKTTPPETPDHKASTQTPSPPPTPSILFSAFPGTLSGTLPDPGTLHFVIQTPEFIWQQNTLNIRFSLQYRAAPPKSSSSEGNVGQEKEPQGSQQGRIMILARGPDTLLAYPSGVLAQAGASNLLNPEEGESFSVSHFREVSADFGPLPSKDSILDLEIFVFNKDGQEILAYQKFSLKDSE